MTTGVALVGIGAGLGTAIDREPSFKGMDSQRSAVILEWCAIIVAVVQALIMSMRTLLSEKSLFKILFSMGTPPLKIAVIRGIEFLLGLTTAALVGAAISGVGLHFMFEVSLSQISAEGWGLVGVVGLIPIVLMVFVPTLAKTFKS